MTANEGSHMRSVLRGWLFTLSLLLLQLQPVGAQSPPPVDWLVDPSSFKAEVSVDTKDRELTIQNSLVRRVLRLAPNAATVDYKNLVTGEQLLRATGPEARVTINGTEFLVGGLEGQPVLNYLKADWIESLRAIPHAYQFAQWKEEPLAPRLAWKKRPKWLSHDLPWPPPGKQVMLRFVPPSGAPKLVGKVLFEEPFRDKLDEQWKTRVSKTHERSSFNNEGKLGEIYALPDAAVYADRPWPAEGATVEMTFDAGDDELSNAWGPGLALIAPDRTVAVVARPNQQRFEVDGRILDTQFDRSLPCTLRIRWEAGQAVCEAKQQGDVFQLLATVEMPKAPQTLHVGKVGRGGSGEDFPGVKGDKLVRCHIRHVLVRGPEPVERPRPAQRTDLPEVEVRYAVYDGLPLIEKWLTVRNTTDKTIRVNKTVVETLRVQENESATEPNINWELSSLYVETDYAYLAMNGKAANQHSVKWLPDKKYETQVNYPLETPCLLEVAPEFGPDTDVGVGKELTSIRCFELFRDGTDRERRGLAQRRMYRTIAPWTQENPVMVHLISDNPDAIRKIVDQGAEVGVEMIILSFGSGMNMESRDLAYQTRYKAVAEYALSKGIVIGAYSLLASRGAATAEDNCRGGRVRYGTMPCLGAKWGQEYLAQLQKFLTNTGFGILEHDGSYPGDTCAATDHPGHHGLDDSQWVQYQAIAGFYKWCRSEGIYLNIPDWYYLSGGSKCAMNYKETNWSLPRNEQEIIERQNIYDGTWEKTASMGWMFVPLTQYHGGGAAATIEPLHEHLDHYEARLSNLFGAGVQACYRGPRIYDTEETKALVKKWISFYKQHRAVLDADLVHLRRPDGRDWDGFVHVHPQGPEKALAFFYNPLGEAIEREIRVPLHYAGLADRAQVAIEDAAPSTVQLDKHDTATLRIRVPARGRTWVLFTAAH
jgi:hypothetical protein